MPCPCILGGKAPHPCACHTAIAAGYNRCNDGPVSRRANRAREQRWDGLDCDKRGDCIAETGGWSPRDRKMDIFLSVKPSAGDLSGLFEVELPIEILQDWSDEKARRLEPVHTVILTENASEFPFGLSFQPQGNEHEDWLLASARTLSVQLCCRTLYSGNPVEPDNPFLCIVFDSGRAFLADDEGSALAEGRGGPVSIVRRMPELDADSA